MTEEEKLENKYWSKKILYECAVDEMLKAGEKVRKAKAEMNKAAVDVVAHSKKHA